MIFQYIKFKSKEKKDNQNLLELAWVYILIFSNHFAKASTCRLIRPYYGIQLELFFYSYCILSAHVSEEYRGHNLSIQENVKATTIISTKGIFEEDDKFN